MKLSADATLADVLPHLSGEKRVFVANVRYQMEKAREEHGPVTVRIGITGNGSRPSVRIDRTGAPPLAFDANFNAFTEAKLSEEAWSTQAMTFEDVHALLERIRSVRSKSMPY